LAHMVEAEVKFTRSDFNQLPEELRVELIDGALLKMAAPTVLHQELAKAAFARLVDCTGWDRVLFGPVGFDIDETHILVPDVVAFSDDGRPERGARSLTQAEIVVEVLSPSTANRDRSVKSQLYLSAGVSEVWLIDPRAETVEVRTDTGVRTASGSEFAASRAIAGFELSPAELFRPT
jgi:Uma2 family endonuclease